MQVNKELMMKARKTGVRYGETAKQASQDTLVDEHVASIARLHAQVMARSDSAERIAHVEMLKALIDSGSYRVDSSALAREMQTLFAVLGEALRNPLHTGNEEG